jgi:uncharacterized OsmC-like protein
MATATRLSTIVNGVNIDALAATVDAVQATPSIAKFNFKIQNQWEVGPHNRSVVDEFHGGGEERSRTKPFVLRSDEPPVLLGHDTAPNPVEYLLHALAACVTTSMVYHASARGITLQHVECSLDGDIDLHGFLALDPTVRNGYQGIRMNFTVKADCSDDQLEDLLQLGIGRSPVFDSLTNGVPVKANIARL